MCDIKQDFAAEDGFLMNNDFQDNEFKEWRLNIILINGS